MNWNFLENTELKRYSEFFFPRLQLESYPLERRQNLHYNRCKSVNNFGIDQEVSRENFMEKLIFQAAEVRVKWVKCAQ